MAKNKPKRELAEVDLLDTKLSSLVEILEERGILTKKEWETTINKNIVIK